MNRYITFLRVNLKKTQMRYEANKDTVKNLLKRTKTIFKTNENILFGEF